MIAKCAMMKPMQGAVHMGKFYAYARTLLAMMADGR